MLICVILLFTFVKSKLFSVQIPDYGEDLELIHLKLNTIMEALEIKPPIHKSNNKYINKHRQPQPLTSHINTKYKKPNELHISDNNSQKNKGYNNQQSFKDIDIEQEIDKEQELITIQNSNNKNENEISNKGLKEFEGIKNGEFAYEDGDFLERQRRFNRTDIRGRSTTIRANVDNFQDFESSKGVENHEGFYKGGEFNVDYNLNQQDAIFNDLERNNEIESKQGKKFKLNSKELNKDRFNGNKFIKYGDESNDEMSRKNGYNYGIENEKYDTNLYDKYKENENPNKIKDNTNYKSKYRVSNDLENDNNYKEYGESFGNDRYYGNEFNNINNINFGNKQKSNEFINTGRLSKVKANGKNNEAFFTGNYKTSDAHDKFKDKQNYNVTFRQKGRNINPEAENAIDEEYIDESDVTITKTTGKRHINNFDKQSYGIEKKNKLKNNNSKNKYRNDELYFDSEKENEKKGYLRDNRLNGFERDRNREGRRNINNNNPLFGKKRNRRRNRRRRALYYN